ncbi:MAG TPA: hypothetical protein VHI93_05255 [Candidatus Thermoplasmatota archaeon]|nr:hypothetical protein [Candidatus Thermoplasmatota archaeon]
MRHVRGDFMVSLWQWDAQVTSDSGTQPLPSGQEPMTPGGEAPGYPYITVSRDRQVFLKVTDGDFLLPAYTADSSRLYLFEPGIQSIGSLTLKGVSGYLGAQGRDVHADELTLLGDFTVTVARSEGSGIPLRVESTSLGDGSPVAIGRGTLPGWAWAAGILALAAVPAGLALRRRRMLPYRATERSRKRALALFDYAETSTFEGDYRRARRLLDRAIRLEGLRPDFFALRARCRAALGDIEGALRDHLHAHEAFPATEPDALASNAFEAARTCSRAGQRDAALTWLRLAMQYDPHCTEDARDDPLLLPLFLQAPSRRPSAAR